MVLLLNCGIISCVKLRSNVYTTIVTRLRTLLYYYCIKAGQAPCCCGFSSLIFRWSLFSFWFAPLSCFSLPCSHAGSIVSETAPTHRCSEASCFAPCWSFAAGATSPFTISHSQPSTTRGCWVRTSVVLLSWRDSDKLQSFGIKESTTSPFPNRSHL